MSNEIIERLVRLEAGQTRLEAGQAKLEAGQAKLEARQTKLEAGQARLETRMEAGLARLEGRLDKHDAALKDIKDSLSQVLPLLIKIVEGQARTDERLAHMPQPEEFYELRGRVEELSRRLPVTLAYQQPAPRP